MNNIQNSFNENIKKIYDKTGYLDKYGGSVIACVLILTAFFCVFSYFYVMNHIKPIKSDWINKRCQPYVLPFAGLINTPPGKSKFDFTAENFAKCTNDILAEIVSYFLKPIYFLTSIATNMFGELSKSVQMVRLMINYLREKIDAIVKNIMLRIFGTLVPIQKALSKMKSLIQKLQGVMVSTLFTAMGSFFALKSFIGAFLELVILTLVLAVAAIIVLWIIPFTWPAAAAGTAFFLLISIPIAIIAGWMIHILEISSRSVPAKPGCFDKNTIIKMKNGNKNISDIKIGDVLFDDSVVTGVFKIAYRGVPIYNLDGVTVTGSHKIFLNDDKLIYASEYPGAQIINNYSEEFVYCINTDTKKIKINSLLFSDWDEIEKTDLFKLKRMRVIPRKIDIRNIHKYLDGGFHGDTLIEMEDGSCMPIREIEPNDQLKFGEDVLGVVKINANDLIHVKKYEYNDSEFIGGANLQVVDNLGVKSTLKMFGTNVSKPKFLYHLITNKGTFYVNGLKFLDYDGCIEHLLDFPKIISATV